MTTPRIAPLLPDMRAGWLGVGQLGKYVSFLACWPHSPVVVRVTAKLVGVIHREHETEVILTHFESGWDDETHVGIPTDTPVRLLAREPKESEL